MKKVLGFITIFLFVLSSLSFSAAQGVTGKKVLILKNVDAWNSNANEQILTELGVSYDVMTASQLSSLAASDLINTYDMILITSDQNQVFYNDLGPQMPKLEEFVKAGKVLQIHAANWGWHGGRWTTPLPAGVEIVNSYSNYEYMVKNGTWLYSTYSSHGYLINVPTGAEIITVQGDGSTPDYSKPSTIIYSFGSGRVMASGLTFEYSVRYGGPEWKAFLKELIVDNLEYSKKKEEKPEAVQKSFNYVIWNFFYYRQYQKATERFNLLYSSPEAGELDNETLELALFHKTLAEQYYAKAEENGPIFRNLNSIKVFINLRKAYFYVRDAVGVLEESMG
ncbi:pyrolysin [Thermococcus bergensis]|uniref:pyrolysin n=1 Tax=Thermococcus bergensis TaxID=2689387 RepID=UPI001CEC2DFB|nr:pyrolysin [Thermococcus bergensis]